MPEREAFLSCRSLLREGERQLKEAGVEEAGTDARLLFLHAFSLRWNELLLHYEESPERLSEDGENAVQRFLEAIQRRAAHEPLQYITHEQSFCGLDFYVDRRVLIPRQDTELLVETVLSEQRKRGETLLDLCTGSGCIALALARLGSFSSVTAADISGDALSVAAENARRFQIEAELVCSDLFSALTARRFDVITANPPYIRTEVVASLMPEVREHEPLLALDGSGDGLSFYRRLAEESPAHLLPGGRLCLEIGFDQGEAVLSLLRAQGFQELRCVRDLAGLDRVVTGRMAYV